MASTKNVSQKGRCAADQPDRPDRDAGLIHVHQHEADAVVFGNVRVGANQREDPVGEMGAGGPYLLAVDKEVIAVVLGACVRKLARSDPAPGSL